MEIKWTESYNIHKANIANVIVLIVAYDGNNGGYKVSVSGAYSVSLKNNSEGLEDGKNRAIALGKQMLQKALDKLS